MPIRYNSLLMLPLCFATVCLGSEPQPSQLPPMPRHSTESMTGNLSALDHLCEAAEQLKSVGMAEEAARVVEVADQLNREVIRERAELHRQIQELQNRSERLRELTGKPDKILCRCYFLELSSQSAAEFEAIAEPVNSRTVAGHNYALTVYKNAEDALLRLKKAGKVTILASPQITTASGCPATSTSGEEFPRVTPGQDGQTSVHYQFGVSCDVLPHLLDAGRLKLEFAPEITRLDFKNSVNVNGLKIPGMMTRRVNTAAELNLGETLVISLVSKPASQSEAASQPEQKEVPAFLTTGLTTSNPENNVTMFMVTPVAVH